MLLCRLPSVAFLLQFASAACSLHDAKMLAVRMLPLFVSYISLVLWKTYDTSTFGVMEQQVFL